MATIVVMLGKGKDRRIETAHVPRVGEQIWLGPDSENSHPQIFEVRGVMHAFGKRGGDEILLSVGPAGLGGMTVRIGG